MTSERVYWGVPALCGGDSTRFLCKELVLKLEPQHAIAEIQPLLEELGAQVTVTWEWMPSSVGATIVLFDTFRTPLVEAMNRLGADPAVELVSLNVLYPLEPWESPTEAAVAVVPTVPWAENALEVASGTRVSVRYVQPTGDTLEAFVTVR